LNIQTVCRQQNPYLAQNICHFAHTHIGADSQKQYWDIKQKYRDVILFFKIGTFYELYEDDAQIGHDVLGWKMTITGVGHCRQVMLALIDMFAQSLRFGILVHFAVVSLQLKQTMQPMLPMRCSSQRGKCKGRLSSRSAGMQAVIVAFWLMHVIALAPTHMSSQFCSAARDAPQEARQTCGNQWTCDICRWAVQKPESMRMLPS